MSNCIHMGARYRWNALDKKAGYEGLTMHTAWDKFQLEEGTPLSLSEKREFFNGWRRGTSTFALEEMHYILNRLNADDMEQFGSDLLKVVRKWHAIIKESR